MSTLSAKIDQSRRSRFGGAKHLQVIAHDEGMEFIELSDPVGLQIVEDDAGYYLYRLDNLGSCLADTWHQTLEEAMNQAMFEYAIEAADWVKIQ